ncbi:MAG: hypothetical protein ABI680_00885 [Chthoniobacteraceae bacterium]
MKRSQIISAALFPVVACLFSGCETTGDPTQGGLFGWSEGKAKARRSSLEHALYLEDERGADASDSNRQLERTRSRNASTIRAERARLSGMLSQLDAVDARGGNTSSLRSQINAARTNDSLDDAQLRSRVNTLNGEVRSMRAEYGLLIERQ